MRASPWHRLGLVAGQAARTPSEFREFLQQLGPTYIKIGQFLALRPDLLPQEYCDELMYLLDRIPPLPWAQAKTIIEEDLHAPVTELFARVTSRPVAAGSLAQTHVGYLIDGTEVAIKVQRPDARSRVLRDLEHPQVLQSLLESSGVSLLASPREIVRELTDWMLRELNFTNELANVSRLRDLAAGSRVQFIPRPYPQLCGPRVLTAAFVSGLRVSEWLLKVREDPARSDDLVPRELGLSRRQFAENLITAILTQIFDYHFFHADPHPGNLMAMAGNVVGFVDFGLCDEVDPLVRERQMHYVAAVYGQDADQMFSAVSEVLIPGDETDLGAFRRDFLAEIRMRRSERGSRIDKETASPERGGSPIARSMIGVMRVVRRHGLHVPPGTLALYRALLTAETIAQQLGTDVNLRSVGQQFFARLQVDYALRTLTPESVQSISLNLLDLWRDAPGQVHQLLTELSEGRFVLNAYISESTRKANVENRRVRLIVLAIVSVGIATLLIRPNLPAPFGISLAWPLSAVLLALYLLILIQWRRLR